MFHTVLWLPAVLSLSAAMAAGQDGPVTTPAFTGNAESVTGTEQVVTARIAVATTTTSTATQKLQVATARPEPPPQPAAEAPAPAPAPEPPPAPSPALRHKELPRTDSSLPLMAVLGLSLLAVSGGFRYLARNVELDLVER